MLLTLLSLMVFLGLNKKEKLKSKKVLIIKEGEVNGNK